MRIASRSSGREPSLLEAEGCDHGVVNSHAVIETDTDGVIQRWNGGAEEMFGHSAAVAIGLRVDFIVPSTCAMPTGPDSTAR